MVKEGKFLAEFNKMYLKSEQLSHAEALQVFEELWKEAASLGIVPLEDPLEGIEVDIRIARILNHVRRTSRQDRTCS